MKKKIFTLIVAAAAAAGAGAQIGSLPLSADFEETTAPFDAGIVKAATEIGNVLCVSNTTATAPFAVGGEGAYAIADNEEVTVQFSGLHGWAGDESTSTIQLVNSDGVVLVGYTYTRKACQVTDVQLGGQTAAGFTPFTGQANFNNNKSANGFTHSQHYVNTENYTPKLTFKVHGLGAVTFNMVYQPAKKALQDITYSANLDGVKMDLAKIVIIDNCSNEDRAIGIDNLSIASAEKVLYKYVINYVDENDVVVKKEEGSAEKGTKIDIATDPVWADGVKYYVEGDDSEENLVDESNNTVITVRVKQAATYKYTVIATDGTNTLATLADKAYFEGETVGYAYPRYFNVDGTLFKKDPTDQVYNGSFVLDEDGKLVEAVYAATETTGVIFFTEAEDIAGLKVCNTGTVADRCSYRAGAYSSEDAKIVKLAAGTYKLIAAAYGGSYSFKAGDAEVLNIASAGSWRETVSEEFTLADAADLTFVGGSGEAGSLDYVVLQSADGAVVSEVTRWDFTNWSAETVANLKADAAASSTIGWSDVEKKADAEAGNPAPEATADKCFWLTDPEGGELEANGVAIAELQGLTFGSKYAGNRSLAIAVDYPSTTLGTYNGPQYLWLGGGGKNMPCFVIPNVKGGTEIKMGVESHKASDARGVRLYVKTDEVDANGDPAISGEPLKDIEGNEVALPKTYTEQAWYLPEDADIIVYNTSGCHLYYIECVQTSATTTAINTVEGEQKMPANAIFTLSGQRVEQPGKGLYIVGGRKVIFK
jgi:hypothetical protein